MNRQSCKHTKSPVLSNTTNELVYTHTHVQVKLNEEPDRRLFSSLVEELERIEGAIDPYSDPDLLEQWTLCIGNIMRHQQAPSASGKQ